MVWNWRLSKPCRKHSWQRSTQQFAILNMHVPLIWSTVHLLLQSQGLRALLNLNTVLAWRTKPTRQGVQPWLLASLMRLFNLWTFLSPNARLIRLLLCLSFILLSLSHHSSSKSPQAEVITTTQFLVLCVYGTLTWTSYDNLLFGEEKLRFLFLCFHHAMWISATRIGSYWMEQLIRKHEDMLTLLFWSRFHEDGW